MRDAPSRMPPPRRGAARPGRRDARGLGALLVAGAFAVGLSPPLERRSDALVWPDVAERIHRDLGATDVATRRSAAREIASVGPGRGVAFALAALNDPDADVRLAAADAAVRLRAVAATPLVTAWLNAPDPRLRRGACAVASALPDRSAIAPLARALGDPYADVRGAAADALGHQASADAVAPLLGRMDDSTPAVRIAIVQALARLGDVRAVVPLVGKIEDSSAEVRQQVARALGDLQDARASAALVLALRDQNTEVRRQALVALGRLRSGEAVDAIAPFVVERAPSLRLAASAALGEIATSDALRVLVGVLGTGDDATPALSETPVRTSLLMTGTAAVPALAATLAAPASPLAAASAAWVLGALHARDQAPALVSALRRGSLPAAPALHALAGAGTSAEVPVVLEFLTDSSPSVRDEAIGAATALLDPTHPDGRAVEPLTAALRSPRASPEEQTRLARCLGRTGAPRAVTVIADLVRRGDVRVRLAAIDALGTLGAAAADESLLGALAAPEATVRLHAAQALADAGGATARDRLLAILDREGEADRASVLFALGGILGRVPSDGAVGKLTGRLDLASGPDRDAILEAVGRAPTPGGLAALVRASKSGDALDRSQAAALSAAQRDGPGGAGAAALDAGLLSDADSHVRAQAAWALGTLGAREAIGRLMVMAHADDADVATDATAAIARIAAADRDLHPPIAVLCNLVDDARPFVRANALAGLALARARCEGGDGERERQALANDASEIVRSSAALALASSPRAADRGALDRCVHSEASGAVVAHCRGGPHPDTAAAAAHPALIYILPERAEAPRPGAPYALLFADGLVRAGIADRRGAVFEPRAPEGSVMLLHGE